MRPVKVGEIIEQKDDYAKRKIMKAQSALSRTIRHSTMARPMTYQLISGQVLPIQLPYDGNDARSVADRELA